MSWRMLKAGATDVREVERNAGLHATDAATVRIMIDV